MAIKLVVGGITLNVISYYAPQAVLDEVVKRCFWEGLDEVVHGIPPTEKLFIGGDFNKHIGSSAGRYGEEERQGVVLCEYCKVYPSETLASQHRLLVMDVGIMITRNMRFVQGQPRIRWEALMKVKAQELEGRLLALGAWRSSGDERDMWTMTADCIREAAKEVLGVSKGYPGRYRGDW
uniref:Uncharacterized protein LOC104231313 n=1 Tax=Nicotiana sylvestris TaxID=4096 RepID=A0A1U7WRN0_NICSY|nr:PREDICTED: uncharacterized protein LOC104231313 [Nicotiana sylvestris]